AASGAPFLAGATMSPSSCPADPPVNALPTSRPTSGCLRTTRHTARLRRFPTCSPGHPTGMSDTEPMRSEGPAVTVHGRGGERRVLVLDPAGASKHDELPATWRP